MGPPRKSDEGARANTTSGPSEVEEAGSANEAEEEGASSGRKREVPAAAGDEGPVDESASPPKKQRKSRKGIPLGKKPAGMPRRPLSGYNFFFSEQRTKILQERRARQASGETDSDKDLFSAMGRLVGQRWKQLSPSDREKYELLAQEDLVRYRKEMDEYNEKIARRNREASGQVASGQTPSNESNTTDATALEGQGSTDDRKPSARTTITERDQGIPLGAAAPPIGGLSSFPQQALPQNVDANLANLIAQQNLISSASSQQLTPSILQLAAQRQQPDASSLLQNQSDPGTRTLEALRLQLMLQQEHQQQQNTRPQLLEQLLQQQQQQTAQQQVLGQQLQQQTAQPQLFDQLLQQNSQPQLVAQLLQQHNVQPQLLEQLLQRQQQLQLQSQLPPTGVAGIGLSAPSQPSNNLIQEAATRLAVLEHQRQRDQEEQIRLLLQQQQQQQQQQQPVQSPLQLQVQSSGVTGVAAAGAPGEQADAEGSGGDDDDDESSERSSP